MTEGFVNLLTVLRKSRVSLVFVVAVLALTQLAGFAHFALVAHEQCPEHGDWMHVHAGAVQADDSPEPTWHDLDVADSHDHCSAPTALRDRLAMRALVAQPALQTVAILPTLQHDSPAQVLPPRVSWRSAPKTSPPA